MEFLCEVCTKLLIEGHAINNPNLDEIDKILNDYVTSKIRNSLYMQSIANLIWYMTINSKHI